MPGYEVLEDPRFKTVEQRQRHIDERLAVRQGLRDRPAEECFALLEKAGVPCAPVLTRNATLTLPKV